MSALPSSSHNGDSRNRAGHPANRPASFSAGFPADYHRGTFSGADESPVAKSKTRAGILRLLRAHAAGNPPPDPREAAMLADMIRFVEEHADCAERSLRIGHLTGSAWIVDAARRRTLLTHHRKLDKWLQLGGHADGDLDLAAVALREAREESGLTNLRLAHIPSAGLKAGTVRPDNVQIFDVDRHRIPARGSEPEHWHYDVRFLVEADPGAPLVVTSESKELAWVALDDVARLNPEESMLRMVRKTLAASRD